MSEQNTKGKVPYDKHGNMLASQTWRQEEWRENVLFEATLRLVDIDRGRSAVTFWFVDEATDQRYPLNLTQAEPLLKDYLVHGRVRANWIAVQRGDSYSLKAVQVIPLTAPPTPTMEDLGADPGLVAPSEDA